jgi:hypothetical protein
MLHEYHVIYSVRFHVTAVGLGQWRMAYEFRILDKAEPNSLFNGKHIRDNLIRIRGSLIFKLSGTPD